MNSKWAFSFTRWCGIVFKEFHQLTRDRLTYGMIIGLPIMQLLLFGYAINNDPKNMPTALVLGEQSQFTRSIEYGLLNSKYFAIVDLMSESEAEKAMARGEVYFIVTVPSDFSHKLLRGDHPAILVEADATDPTATDGALAATQGIIQSVITKEIPQLLANLRGKEAAFSVQIHKKYNPEGLTSYNIVPGLMGLVLTMKTVMMTGLSITRERERGNMENLLSTPVSSLEIMTGKILPYIFICHIQVSIIIMSTLLFHIPFVGSFISLYLVAVLFVIANLTVGVTLSSFAKNQLQSMQMTIIYILPNFLLSGFIFPFSGMPKWAQTIGNLLPLTYFNRAVRGIFLKGSDWHALWPNIWPLALFCVVLLAVASKFFRRTLD